MWLPFTADQFLDVFRRYNLAVWPAQPVLTAAGVVAVLVAAYGRGNSGRVVSGILGALWLWMSLAYHVAFFVSINRAAVLFAAVFAGQAALFVWIAFRTPVVSYRPQSIVSIALGAVLFAYALVVYPAISYAVGHRYPAAPTFGLPCPTTILTLGLLAWAGTALPRRVFIVPLLWAVIGTSAALSLGMVEDCGLLVSAIAVLIWVPLGRRVRPNAQPVSGPDGVPREKFHPSHPAY
jgi:hypothetical protein